MTDTEFMSAADKETVLRQWRIFLKQLLNCDFDKLFTADYGPVPVDLELAFTERLYKHLSLHEGFIAHYNRLGFLSARFGTPEFASQTLQQIRRGIPYPGFMDLHNAMVEAMDGMRNGLSRES